MNYQKIYNNIISKAKSEKRKKKQGIYYENHHILPKCLGGNNLKENKVLLTAREHFIAHKLLVEIHPNEGKLVYALWMMMNVKKIGERNYKVSPKEYGIIKLKLSKEVSNQVSGKKNPFYGKTHKGESLQKIKDRVKIQIKEGNHPSGKLGKENHMFGIKFSNQRKNKYSKMFSGEKNPMYGKTGELSPAYGRTGEKHPMFGKNHSDETKRKMSEASVKLHLIKSKCQFCGKMVSKSHFKMYHGNNCKQNPNYKPIIYKCPYCPKEGVHIQTMKQFHFDKCKYKNYE